MSSGYYRGYRELVVEPAPELVLSNRLGVRGQVRRVRLVLARRLPGRLRRIVGGKPDYFLRRGH